ncbi:MAG: methyltransferase domain-containing protein [Pirellulales bacterium]
MENPIAPLTDDAPRRVLEVGPGTGTVTDAILRRLRPADRLTIVEINPEFVAHLKKRFESEPAWKNVADQVVIETKPVQEFAADEKFDVVVSGLPLNNFPVDVVREILAGFDTLAAPGSTISFFEYIAIRRVKWLVTSRADREHCAASTNSWAAFCRPRNPSHADLPQYAAGLGTSRTCRGITERPVIRDTRFARFQF